mgnify:CR=1 FL=1
MKIKTANLLCALALVLQVAGALFAFVLLCMGKLSECFPSSSDAGEAIGAACVSIMAIFFIVLAMVCQAAASLVGLVTVFSGKRKVSVTVGTTFITIFSAAAIALYFFTFVMISSSANSSGTGIMGVSLWFSIIVCIYTVAVYIASGAMKNKAISGKKKQADKPAFEEVKGESGEKTAENFADNSTAEEATYSKSEEDKK